MFTSFQRRLTLALTSLSFVSSAFATTVPYTESFDADAANWREGTGAANAAWTSTGGADAGGYVSSTYNFVGDVPGNTPIFLRGHDTYGSSGLAFVGDWLADGVTEFSAYVRHNAPVPLNYFVRFAKPSNFPAAIGVEFVPVFPNTWTRIDIAIYDGNPEFVNFETSDFNTIFSGIGKLQLGVNVPGELAGADSTYTFDFDLISIVPEPSAGLAIPALAMFAVRRRR